jgi:hypothetical protein
MGACRAAGSSIERSVAQGSSRIGNWNGNGKAGGRAAQASKANKLQPPRVGAQRTMATQWRRWMTIPSPGRSQKRRADSVFGRARCVVIGAPESGQGSERAEMVVVYTRGPGSVWLYNWQLTRVG